MTVQRGEQKRRREITRRRFLQAALAVGGTAALDTKLFGSSAWAGPPLGPTDRILVLIELAGGNDGLNTVVPVADPAYASLRGALAIPAASTLNVGEGLGLHPSLTYLKSRFDAGDVAIVRGVGHGDKDLSHFSCMAKVMAGTTSGVATTGLFGRWLDGMGLDGFGGVNIGDSDVPLILDGQQAEVTGLPTYGGLFGSATPSWETVAFDALSGLGNDALGLGAWGDVVADTYQAAIQRARDVNRIYSPNISGNRLARDLTLAARLINLDLGARIITVLQGGYDTHSDQLDDHARFLTNLDAGISTFFQNLAPQFHNRVVVMTYSEFGRRVRANDSAGTDHGTASVMFLVGNHARRGLHGSQPSLSQLDSRGDLNIAVDVRSVFASVLNTWFGADDAQVLGANWPKLDLFDPYSGAGYPDPTLPTVAYQSLAPLRILDTRSGIGPGRVVRLGPGETIDLAVAGQANVPATGAGAVIANVTVTGCDAPTG